MFHFGKREIQCPGLETNARGLPISMCSQSLAGALGAHQARTLPSCTPGLSLWHSPSCWCAVNRAGGTVETQRKEEVGKTQHALFWLCHKHISVEFGRLKKLKYAYLFLEKKIAKLKTFQNHQVLQIDWKGAFSPLKEIRRGERAP